uniref:Uncharacterized protein n=1 Tax=Acrobeloides nanus TaxID=290746 RepID=A0A914DRP6_9BILA
MVLDIIQGCGTTKGCFIAPPNCENSPNLVCTSIFTWTAQNDGIQFFIAGTPTNYAPEENGVPVSDLYYYVAVAFSLDEFMGADTVITCITGNDVSPPTSSSINTNLTKRNQKPGNILVSWNDAFNNYIIFDASDSIIRVGNVGMQNSRIYCNGFWNFSGRKNIRYPERTYDLSSPNMKWHILVARGTANRNTYALNGHSIVDGESFPWTTRDTINLCTRNGCGENFIPYKYLKSAYQAYPLGIVTHKVAVSH